MRIKRKANLQKGFTLVELSIVLVIIGLIVASVLVGQDLIRQGELRATVTQLEQFNAAVQTFNGKYGGIPGDLDTSNLFSSPANTGGDGDGILEDEAQTVGAAKNHDGEFVEFWTHLGASGAGLISGDYVGTGATGVGDGGLTINSYTPAAKSGNNWAVYNESGINYFFIGVVDTTAFDTADALSPLDAFSLDSKVDDGRPGRGVVRARSGVTGATDVFAVTASNPDANTDNTATSCVVDGSGTMTTSATYNTNFTALECALLIRFN